MENLIKIIIADDHKIFRDGLKNLLDKSGEFDIIAEAENGTQVLELLIDHQPDVVVMDISMPKKNGIEVLKEVAEIYPKTKFIMLSMHEEGDYIIKCIKLGASGYLLKTVEEEELRSAIKAVHNGKKYFNADISSLMASQLQNATEQVHITPREQEVLELVADGLSTKLIADKLFISARTVESHRLNLMKKFDAINTAELIKKSIEGGFLK